MCEIAQLPMSDGVNYQPLTATSRIIRDQAFYAGVRISMDCAIATAAVKFRLDVNFGDPVTPAPVSVWIPSLRAGIPPVRVLGYPAETVLAERSLRRSHSVRPIRESATTPISTRSPATAPSCTTL